ncbi:hypothetical protein GBQ13_00810 [Mycobacterium avium subsp. hominissuis]|nr:hypothetical protein [Mycobacterium avium subsp. hominissuis]
MTAGSVFDGGRHLAHLMTDGGVVGIPRWSGQCSTAVELLPVTYEGVTFCPVEVHLVDYDVTVRAPLDSLAHLHECSEASCMQVWRRALRRANRRNGPGPDFSLFWWDRDGPGSAVLTHHEDIAALEYPAPAWTVMSLTSWNVADWRIINGHTSSARPADAPHV